MSNPFYPSSLSPEEGQQQLALQLNGQQKQHHHHHQPSASSQDMAGMGHTAAPAGGGLPMEALAFPDADSLDDIVSQNSRALQRRRSVPHHFASSSAPLEGSAGDRRMSMIDFGSTTSDGAFHGFDFGSIAGSHGAMGGGFAALPDCTDMADSSGAAAFPHQGLMTMPGRTDFAALSPGAMASMAAFNLDLGSMMGHSGSGGVYNPPGLAAEYPPATLAAAGQDFAMDMAAENPAFPGARVDPIPGFSLGIDGGVMRPGETFNELSIPQDHRLMLGPGMGSFQTASMSPSNSRDLSAPTSLQSPPSLTSRAMSEISTTHPDAASSTPASTAPAPKPAAPSRPAGPSPRDSKKNIYSKSGFDMLRALWYVATRKKPTVEIGAVDMSCAFVVCDLTLNDCPIIYVSDNFQNLTGYNRHEIVGRNCRFLQSPDGKVEIGSRREFVDNDAVYRLKTAVAEGREIQQSLINYRKGGKPFLNFLTMIPIPWDSDEMRYCIGFQVDLVECPDAISGQESTGAMQVNYRHSDIGQMIWTPPPSTKFDRDSGQTLSVDEVSALIQQHDTTRSSSSSSSFSSSSSSSAPPSEWHRAAWDKMLLENADDLVHVLSLKGLFLYLSPACRRLLEYDAADLVGTPLSAVCHPSDIVPVTRELRDAQPGEPVAVAFRVRRKKSGYMWFESYGRVCQLEQVGRSGGGGGGGGGGRKIIVLVGRPRTVLRLSRRLVVRNSAAAAAAAAHAFPPATPGSASGWSFGWGASPGAGREGVGMGMGGIGDADSFWSKMSASGMFLHVSPAVRALLDWEPKELVGTSMQELIPRKEEKSEFGRAIEKARKGGAASAAAARRGSGSGTEGGEGRRGGKEGEGGAVVVSGCAHELQGKRGQVVMAWTTFYPGDGAGVGRKRVEMGGRPSFLIVQTRVVKGSSSAGMGGAGKSISPAWGRIPGAIGGGGGVFTEDVSMGGVGGNCSGMFGPQRDQQYPFPPRGSASGQPLEGEGNGGDADNGNDDDEDDDIFEELHTTRCTSWQYELRQLEKMNRLLAEEVAQLMAVRKKRKRSKGAESTPGGGGGGGGGGGSAGGGTAAVAFGGSVSGSGDGVGKGAVRDCAHCQTMDTPEWRRGPSGLRDLCNGCGRRWAKQSGKLSQRSNSTASSKTTPSSRSGTGSVSSSTSAGGSFGDNSAINLHALARGGGAGSKRGSMASTSSAITDSPGNSWPPRPAGPDSSGRLPGMSGMMSIREEGWDEAG